MSNADHTYTIAQARRSISANWEEREQKFRIHTGWTFQVSNASIVLFTAIIHTFKGLVPYLPYVITIGSRLFRPGT